MTTTAARTGRTGLLGRLNGRWHSPALTVFMLIVLGHWAEHVAQAVQIWVLGWPVPKARGVLGIPYPWLVSREWLHYGYALVMLVGLFLLRPGFSGRSRTWWTLALGIQVWHHFEHLLLLIQAATGTRLAGGSAPTSVLQLVFPRVELHLFYNAVVFVPMVVAMYLHLRPLPGGGRGTDLRVPRRARRLTVVLGLGALVVLLVAGLARPPGPAGPDPTGGDGAGAHGHEGVDGLSAVLLGGGVLAALLAVALLVRTARAARAADHTAGEAAPAGGAHDRGNRMVHRRPPSGSPPGSRPERVTAMCQHRPACPSADDPDRDAARVLVSQPGQGWSLLCNGVVLFDDLGEILPNGAVTGTDEQPVAPPRPPDAAVRRAA